LLKGREEIDLLSIEHFKKATFASLMAMLILMLLMAVLPFATAHSGDVMQATQLRVPVTIDGAWSAGEWDDAPQYTMKNSTGGNVGYIRAKYNSSHLVVIIDSPWDTTPSNKNWFENVWLAFDTDHDDGPYPKTDDYLAHPTTSWTTAGWVGTGAVSNWTGTPMPGVSAVQAGDWAPTPLATSPNSATPHKLTEMAIPLNYVGSPGSTVGFYAENVDDKTNSSAEWPLGAGGNPLGWPPDGTNPCPAPSAWGDLKLVVPVGGIWIPVDKLALLAPYIGLTLTIIVAMAAIAFFKYRKKQ